MFDSPLMLLVTSILVLLIGPLLCWGFRHDQRMLVVLDGFNFVAIAGLVLFDILPHAFEVAGGWVLLIAAAGLVGPTLLERHVHRLGHGAHATAVFLAIVGLCLHALLDGAGLVPVPDGMDPEVPGSDAHGGHNEHGHDGHDHGHGDDGHASHLPLAVLLHRIPVGLTVWMLLRPGRGRLFAWGTLIMMVACTVGGWTVGKNVVHDLSGGVAMACFQALMAGMLMHVVIHRPHRRAGSEPIRQAGLLEGLGGLAGLAILFVIFKDLLGWHGLAHPVAKTFSDFAFESAPALLFGYLMAGFVSVLLPTSSIRWMRAGRPWNQSLRGMAVGLPIPVCSCGVVPIYRSLVQRGAPATAAMAFLVATPELGFDAVFLSISLLGAEFTLLRVGTAAVVALLIGWIVGSWTMRAAPKMDPVEEGSCCGTEAPRALGGRLREGLRIGLGEVVDHTGPWIIVGIALAALIGPVVGDHRLANVPASLQVPLFALIGIPAYVCASGATPLVAVLLLNGLSPGAAIAFLLTGPATNITTFGVVSRLHDRRVAIAFGVVMLMLAVGSGYLINGLFGDANVVRHAGDHDHGRSAIQATCLAILVITFLASFLRRGPRNFVAEIFQADVGEDGAVAHDHSHDHSHERRDGPGDGCA